MEDLIWMTVYVTLGALLGTPLLIYIVYRLRRGSWKWVLTALLFPFRWGWYLLKKLLGFVFSKPGVALMLGLAALYVFHGVEMRTQDRLEIEASLRANPPPIRANCPIEGWQASSVQRPLEFLGCRTFRLDATETMVIGPKEYTNISIPDDSGIEELTITYYYDGNPIGNRTQKYGEPMPCAPGKWSKMEFKPRLKDGKAFGYFEVNVGPKLSNCP